MKLEDADTVIKQLEAGIAGGSGALPSNADIVAVFAFLEKHLGHEDTLTQSLAGCLRAETLRLDQELPAGLRTLLQRLRARMRSDQQLKRRILHVPNRIPLDERLKNFAFAACLSTYAGIAAWADDFFIPGKRGHGVHLHGAAVWVMLAACLCAVVVLLAVVVDHYDTRDNERVYERAGKTFRVVGWTLVGLAFVVHLITGLRS